MLTIDVLLGDPGLPDMSKPGGAYTADDHDQVERLRQALDALHEYRFEYWNKHDALIDDLRARRPHMVLNFCDTGWRNDARRELHIPALLEMLEIPYSGSGPVALGLCYDKALVRAVAAAHGVPVPAEVLLRPGEPLPAFDYPAFVKPNRGDGSVGITPESIVHSAEQAAARIDALRAAQPGTDILLQEFLSGEEYGLGLIGNLASGLTPLPTMRIDYSALDPNLPRLLDYSSKVDPESPYWRDLNYPAANLPAATQAALTDWCAILFDRLQLRDYARFDWRADRSGQLKLMEVNPNPAWCWDGKFAHMGELAGLSHSAVLGRIITAALTRVDAGGSE